MIYKIIIITAVLLASFVIMPNQKLWAQTQDNIDLVENIRSGELSLNDAATQISEAMDISIPNAQEIVQNIRSNLNIDIPTAADILDSLDSDNISENVARALTEFNNIGNLLNPDSIADVFENPIIQNALSEFNTSEEALEFINEVTSLVSDFEEATNAIQEQIMEATAEVIPQEILDLFGGLDGLISSLTSGIGPSIPSIGATGEYEIFTRDPKSSVNSGSCDMPCNCTCKTPIQNNHRAIRAHTTDEFIKHRTWMIDEFFSKQILPAMGLMASQLSAISVQQVQIIGSFFDAKHQLETQRLFQELVSEAHKDYQPSEGICEIGTNVRSLAASDKKSKLTKVSVASRMMDRQLRKSNTLAGVDRESDRTNRLYNFIDTYCNKTDNADGLVYLCNSTSGNDERMNNDIQFTRTIESKLTLDIDVTDPTATPDHADVLALSANLFAHDPLPSFSSPELATFDGTPRSMALIHQELRSIAAKRSVAQNSFASLLSQRANGDSEVAPFLKKLVTELDMSPEDAEEILGENPSYFAQMEVLTKDLYQNPEFYTELYDKPANVLRKSAALRAISLIQDRDLFESQLRSEAILSITLEAMLQDEKRRLDGELKALEVGRN